MAPGSSPEATCGPLAPTAQPTASEAEADCPVIVGVDGRGRDGDALALAQTLQRALGGTLLVAHVIAPAPPGRGMSESEALARQDGQRLLAEVAAQLRDDRAHTKLLAPSAPAQALAHLGQEHRASVVVLGSTHHGPVGRIVPGGVALQLAGCSPCPIAIAPAGYAMIADRAIRSLAVAYDAMPESDAALTAAATAALQLDVPLHLYHAMHAVGNDPAWDEFRANMRQFAQGILDTGLHQLPAAVQGTSTVLEGDAGTAVTNAAAERHDSLLFAGSRGYGPLHEALTGGVLTGLLNHASCPLIIVPRSATQRWHPTPRAIRSSGRPWAAPVRTTEASPERKPAPAARP